MENTGATSIIGIFTVKIKEEENLQNVDNSFSYIIKREFSDSSDCGNEIKIKLEESDTEDLINSESLYVEIKLEDDDTLEENSDSFNESCKKLSNRAIEQSGTKNYEKTQTSEKPSTSSSHLRKHEKIPSVEKVFICNICFKIFSRLDDLHSHRQIHREKPFKCNTCFKIFAHSASLWTHARVHTGEKPYKCNACLKTFAHSSTLRNHKRIHTGEKPFECNICFKKFSQLAGLNKHKKLHITKK